MSVSECEEGPFVSFVRSFVRVGLAWFGLVSGE